MRIVGLFLVFCASFLSSVVNAADNVFLQAEDALEFQELKLDGKSKEILNKLIADRRALVSSLSTDKVEKNTAFGTSYSEPQALTEWRTNENAEVRKLIPDSMIKSVEDYATGIREKIEEAKTLFPYKTKVPFNFADKQPGKDYILEILAEAPSPLYEIRVDKCTNVQGNAMIEFSVVRPSDRALVGKKPEKAIIRKSVTLSGTPRDIKVFYRTIIQDMPEAASYNLVAQIQPANPSSL